MVCAGRRHQVFAANWNTWFLQNWYHVIQSLEILMLRWSTGHQDKRKLKALCSINRHVSCRTHVTHTWHVSLSWRHFLKYTMPGTHTDSSLANQGTLSFNSQVTQGNVRGAQNWSVTLWPWPSSSLPMKAFREGSHTSVASFLVQCHSY